MTENFKNYGIVILAAGESVRMGKVKQLLSWGETSLITHVIQTALKSGIGPVAVVIGAEAARVSTEVEKNEVDIIENSEFELGQGTSIHAGSHWATFKKLDGILFLLGDQPLVSVDDIKKIMSLAPEKSIVASTYPDGLGVPAFFSSSFFEELSEIPEDGGARVVLSKNHGQSEAVDLKDHLLDLDTPEDYQKALSRKGH